MAERTGNLFNPEMRVANITKYLQSTGVKTVSGLEICTPGYAGTAVIPAYNEEKGILTTLESIRNAGCLQTLVVDNNSTDRTVDVVKDFARTTTNPVAVISCSIQGYGPTRKTGFSQILSTYLESDPRAERAHYIVMMDADAQLVDPWADHHKRLIAMPNMGAIGVTYRFPASADDEIQYASTLPNYLFSLANLAHELTLQGAAKIQTGTKGGAVEVGSYAAVGGAQDFATDKSGVSAEDRVLGDQIRENGLTVAFNPALNIHDARRVNYELLNGIAALQTYSDSNQTDYRAMKPDDIKAELAKIPTEQWLNYHHARLRSFIRRNVVDPIKNHEMPSSGLDQVLDAHGQSYESLGEDKVAALTTHFIKSDSMLRDIYVNDARLVQ